MKPTLAHHRRLPGVLPFNQLASDPMLHRNRRMATLLKPPRPGWLGRCQSPGRVSGKPPGLLHQGMQRQPSGRLEEQSTPEPFVWTYPEADPE